MMRNAYISFIISLILLIGAGVGYVVWYEKIIAESVRLASLTAEADAKSSDTEKSIASKSSLRALFADASATAGYFLSPSDIVSFLEQFKKTGQVLGTDVSIASVSTDVPPGDTTTQPQHLFISLAIRGSFEAIARTVGAIEYGPYDLSVTTLSIQATQDEKKHITWVANGTFSAGIHALTPASPPMP